MSGHRDQGSNQIRLVAKAARQRAKAAKRPLDKTALAIQYADESDQNSAPTS